MYKNKAFFIVFEGIEGCGKSYQCKKLFANLSRRGFKSILTREPGGTKSAEIIRKLILKDYFSKELKEKFDKYTDTLLYLASRNEHIQNKIKPALLNKKIVICDRFTDSTMAYQVYGKKVNKRFIDNIHNHILKGIKPNLTIILKVDHKEANRRLKKRKSLNRYDKFPKKFYSQAQKSFIKIARNKKNYVIFDSSVNNNNLEKKILNIVLNKLKK